MCDVTREVAEGKDGDGVEGAIFFPLLADCYLNTAIFLPDYHLKLHSLCYKRLNIARGSLIDRKMSAQAQMRALLDQLMGTARDGE